MIKYLCKGDKVHGIVEGSKACARGYYFLETSEVLKFPIIQDGILIEDPVKLQEEIDTQYKRDRKAEYPDLGDQLDVIWKQFIQMRFNGESLIQEADDMIGSILATKNKHPKP